MTGYSNIVGDNGIMHNDIYIYIYIMGYINHGIQYEGI